MVLLGKFSLGKHISPETEEDIEMQYSMDAQEWSIRWNQVHSLLSTQHN